MKSTARTSEKWTALKGLNTKREKHVQQIEKPKRFYESRRDSSLVAVDEIDGSHDGKKGQPRRGWTCRRVNSSFEGKHWKINKLRRSGIIVDGIIVDESIISAGTPKGWNYFPKHSAMQKSFRQRAFHRLNTPCTCRTYNLENTWI